LKVITVKSDMGNQPDTEIGKKLYVRLETNLDMQCATQSRYVFCT
jgi:hypothetical protein